MQKASEAAIAEAPATFSAQDAVSFFRHCGIIHVRQMYTALASATGWGQRGTRSTPKGGRLTNLSL